MSVTPHPYQEAKAEAERQRAVGETPEAVAMQEAIFAAVNKYIEYLDRADMFYKAPPDATPDDPGYTPLVVSTALVLTAHPIFGTDITLIDGLCHRLYGMGVDPDPDERGPATPPKSAERRKPRNDPFPP